jgi:hypothetical protein
MADKPQQSEATAVPGGALVLWAGPRDESKAAPLPSFGTRRVDAAFLAQLLAARGHAPAQRGKKRAAPDVGAAAYRDGLGLLAMRPAGRLSRSA